MTTFYREYLQEIKSLFCDKKTLFNLYLIYNYYQFLLKNILELVYLRFY